MPYKSALFATVGALTVAPMGAKALYPGAASGKVLVLALVEVY